MDYLHLKWTLMNNEQFWIEHLKNNYNEKFVSNIVENAFPFSRYIFSDKSIIKIRNFFLVYDSNNLQTRPEERKFINVEKSKHSHSVETILPSFDYLETRVVEDKNYRFKCECFRNKFLLRDIRLKKVIESNELWNTINQNNIKFKSDRLQRLTFRWFEEAIDLKSNFLLIKVNPTEDNSNKLISFNHSWEDINKIGKNKYILAIKNEDLKIVLKHFS